MPKQGFEPRTLQVESQTTFPLNYPASANNRQKAECNSHKNGIGTSQTLRKNKQIISYVVHMIRLSEHMILIILGIQTRGQTLIL